MATLHIEDQHESVDTIKQTLRRSTDEAYKTRLKAIILAKLGRRRYEIVEQLVVDPTSVTLWVQRYNQAGIEALKTNKGGRPKGHPKWDTTIFTALAKELDKGGYWSIPRMMEWLKEHTQETIPEQTVWYRMDKLGYSYKGARPHPVKGDQERQKTFKKGASLRSWRRV